MRQSCGELQMPIGTAFTIFRGHMNNNINRPLQQATVQTLQDLKDVLISITLTEYAGKSAHLSGATIEQHTRHVIELYQCLLHGYGTGLVNYDRRKRDLQLEQNPELSVQYLDDILDQLAMPNKFLTLETGADELVPLSFETNFDRELWYNLEHAIHHMALMRVALKELTDVFIPEHFGVASGTIQHRQRICAP